MRVLLPVVNNKLTFQQIVRGRNRSNRSCDKRVVLLRTLVMAIDLIRDVIIYLGVTYSPRVVGGFPFSIAYGLV